MFSFFFLILTNVFIAHIVSNGGICDSEGSDDENAPGVVWSLGE